MNETRYENMVSNRALESIPLYATDHEIAVAIVGKERAAYFRSILPVLERKGFPKTCPLHGGRPVFLVKLFYQSYFLPEFNRVRYQSEAVRDAEHREEVEQQWKEHQLRKDERKARARANAEAWKEKKRKALEDFRA